MNRQRLLATVKALIALHKQGGSTLGMAAGLLSQGHRELRAPLDLGMRKYERAPRGVWKRFEALARTIRERALMPTPELDEVIGNELAEAYRS